MPLSEGLDQPVGSAHEAAMDAKQLLADLQIARLAAEDAERRLGAVKGERQRATMEWAAASMAQAEWDIEISELREALRLDREKVGQLTLELAAHRSSTSWRVLQRVLAPYRWARSR